MRYSQTYLNNITFNLKVSLFSTLIFLATIFQLEIFKQVFKFKFNSILKLLSNSAHLFSNKN